MFLWEVIPDNHYIAKRRANSFSVNCYTVSERGVELFMSHVFLTAMGRASGEVNVSFESMVATLICVDHWFEGKERSMKINLMPNTTLKVINVYPPERGTPSVSGRLNDIYSLAIDISRPAHCPYYSDDRQIFADRLLHTAHKVWVESWRLMEEVEGHPRRKWPVKLWIHGPPDRVFQIQDDDTLALVEGHPPIDENIARAQDRVPLPMPKN